MRTGIICSWKVDSRMCSKNDDLIEYMLKNKYVKYWECFGFIYVENFTINAVMLYPVAELGFDVIKVLFRVICYRVMLFGCVYFL